jgi:predicted KAP-like P-loop ATPase
MKYIFSLIKSIWRIPIDVFSHGRNQLSDNDLSNSDNSLSHSPGAFDSDQPLTSEQKRDRLGFQTVANRLAFSLSTQATSDGLVASIEGEWGSGKSSLVNLLAHQLKTVPTHTPTVVRFEPWLVGERNGMLFELMSEIATAVEEIQRSEKKPGSNLKNDAKDLGYKLRTYASTLSRQTAPLARLAGVLGVPGGELAARTLDATSAATTALSPPKPLPRIKSELIEGLRKLGRRIVVIIDDMDRLEPQEAAEITRLLKAVANFPNIIYVLCYDPKILADSLKQTLSIDDGSAFLEKIVQVRFKVPQPEAFDLRRWLLEECIELHSSISQEPLPHDQLERLQAVCDLEGGLLTTPRDIVRVTNAIKLYWPPISGKVDYADLVWLQLVKIQSDEIYLWIENYLTECAAISEGASIDENSKTRYAESLKQYFPDSGVSSARSLWTLRDFIPGIKTGDNIDNKDRLFNLANDAEIATFERDRRLGSPQHSRYFFAFSMPAGALEDSRFHEFISAAEASKNLDVLCKTLVNEKRPQGGTKLDLLIDRLKRMDVARLPGNSIPSIIMALANWMDEAANQSGAGKWGVIWPWHSADELLKSLFAKLPKEDRREMVTRAFGSGMAIGWLMSSVTRDEIFAHGRYGGRQKPKEEWLLSEEELDIAIGLLLERFRQADRKKIIKTPEVLSLMFGWLQAGDKDGVLEWVREQQSTDSGFLELLSACRGWMQSDKTYHPLNRRDLNQFLDFDQALKRLRLIADNNDKLKAERALARELLEAAKIGKDH